jgi:hypothetical protein
MAVVMSADPRQVSHQLAVIRDHPTGQPSPHRTPHLGPLLWLRSAALERPSGRLAFSETTLLTNACLRVRPSTVRPHEAAGALSKVRGPNNFWTATKAKRSPTQGSYRTNA